MSRSSQVSLPKSSPLCLRTVYASYSTCFSLVSSRRDSSLCGTPTHILLKATDWLASLRQLSRRNAGNYRTPRGSPPQKVRQSVERVRQTTERRDTLQVERVRSREDKAEAREGSVVRFGTFANALLASRNTENPTTGQCLVSVPTPRRLQWIVPEGPRDECDG